MSKPIGGSYTITHGSVTSGPIRYNASQKKLNEWAEQLIVEDRAVQRLRAKWKKGGPRESRVFKGNPVRRVTTTIRMGKLFGSSAAHRRFGA